LIVGPFYGFGFVGGVSGFEPKNFATANTMLERLCSQPGSLCAIAPKIFCNELNTALSPKTTAIKIPMSPALTGAAGALGAATTATTAG